MRLVGWASSWDQKEGLQPIETQDIDFYVTASELRALATFFAELALKAEITPMRSFEGTVDFADSKTKDTTPICITVHHGEVG